MIKKSLGSLNSAIRYFFMDLLGGQSTRIQLLWFSTFSWATTHFYFGVILPWVREATLIYFAYYCLPFKPIDLNSPYAQSILNSMDIAFTGTVVAYVASKWNDYKSKGNISIKDDSGQSTSVE